MEPQGTMSCTNARCRFRSPAFLNCCSHMSHECHRTSMSCTLAVVLNFCSHTIAAGCLRKSPLADLLGRLPNKPGTRIGLATRRTPYKPGSIFRFKLRRWLLACAARAAALVAAGGCNLRRWPPCRFAWLAALAASQRGHPMNSERQTQTDSRREAGTK